MKAFIIVATICSLLLGWYVVIPILRFLDDISLTPEVNPAPVCGRLANSVIEVPSEYLFFWPEYEGKSSWEVGFTENKKGCDASLISLVLEILWPSMKPFPRFEDGPYRTFGHVTAHLKKGDGMYYERYLNDFLLDTRSHHYGAKKFDKILQLNYVQNVRSSLANESKDIYWTEAEGEISSIIECTTKDASGVYGCEQIWFLPQYKTSIRLSYSADLLPHWANMKIDISNFIKSHIKVKGN